MWKWVELAEWLREERRVQAEEGGGGVQIEEGCWGIDPAMLDGLNYDGEGCRSESEGETRIQGGLMSL